MFYVVRGDERKRISDCNTENMKNFKTVRVITTRNIHRKKLRIACFGSPYLGRLYIHRLLDNVGKRLEMYRTHGGSPPPARICARVSARFLST